MSISAPQASGSAAAARRNLDPGTPPGPTLQILQQYWGYSRFRPGQAEVVEALCQGKDVLAVLPTGGGKSLCFQLPALCKAGLTLVVSPLIALMEDQVASLRSRGIAAASLHSQQAPQQRRRTLRELPRLKLLYLSPETLLSHRVWQQLQRPSLSIAGLIVDEAHCLTQWGDSFRPAYGRLGAVRRALLASKPPGSGFPVAAFTATADGSTRATICASLELETPVSFVRSPHRPNIALQFQRVWTPRQRRQKAQAFLTSQAAASVNMPSGLVYVRRRRDSEALVQQFAAAGFKTAAYHGGLSAPRRRTIEQAWLQGAENGGLPFVVCTSAFGMGVDLPSCRWILHYHLPLLLAEYVQEIGRAGRDGNAALALALVSEPSGWLDPSDRQRDRAFLQALADQQRRCRAIAQRIPAMGTHEQVQKQHPQDGALALALLHRQGQLRWLDPFRYVQVGVDKRIQPSAESISAGVLALKRLKAYGQNPWDQIEVAFR